MHRSDLMNMERAMMMEVVRRRGLGGYSQEAEAILLLCETVMKLLQHTVDEYPQERAAYQVKVAKTKDTAKKSK